MCIKRYDALSDADHVPKRPINNSLLFFGVYRTQIRSRLIFMGKVEQLSLIAGGFFSEVAPKNFENF